MIRCPVAHSAKPTRSSNPASSIVFHLLFIRTMVYPALYSQYSAFQNTARIPRAPYCPPLVAPMPVSHCEAETTQNDCRPVPAVS